MAAEESDSAQIESAATTTAGQSYTPGLLRLPPEIRLQVYELLSSPYRAAVVYLMDSWSRLPDLPITRACRLLRYESIPVLYRHFEASGGFCPGPVPSVSHWLRTIDPCALKFTKGYRIGGYWHYCSFKLRDTPTCDEITIRFGKNGVEVTQEDLGKCCERKIQFDEARRGLIQNFVTKVNEQQDSLKAELTRLVEDLWNLEEDSTSLGQREEARRVAASESIATNASSSKRGSCARNCMSIRRLWARMLQ